ncbi:MAG: hypothetical protein KBA32_01305 [Propionivibrio sp.]|nr:hypothetical protein [Propionivibrio sp.]
MYRSDEVNFGRSIQWAAALLLLVAGTISDASNAWADHRHRHGGVRYGVGVGVMVAPRWDPWFWGPPYYPYTPYPPVIIERAPPVYIEQPQAVPQPAPQPAYWYYCAESNNYYPYVQRCPSGWDRIEPQPGDLR